MSEQEKVEIGIEHLSKRFGDFVALHDVNLNIYEGEVHVFLGPSGCGKTTLLRQIAGFEQPDQGRILHEGRPVQAPEPRRGFMFQEGIHFPWRTVIQNVEFGLEVRGIPKAERRERGMQFLKLVGLDRFADFFPAKISGGMKQKMVLATALVNDPDVLLMDEPFAALDAQTRTYMQQELVRIWAKTNKTIIFVTHSIREALLIGSRISLFKTRPGEIRRAYDLDKLFGKKSTERDPSHPLLGELEAEIYKMMKHDDMSADAALVAEAT